MKAMNLYAFTRIDADYAEEYMNMLSSREHRERCRSHEFLTVKCLVETLLAHGADVSQLDGFFFSFTIQQIGKEFDLVKISPDQAVLNIELKSEAVPEWEIEKQLRQNRYYLEFAAADVRSFTYVASSGEFYRLEGDSCRKGSCEDLIQMLPDFENYLTENIETLFASSQFLISPFSDPEKFLNGKYFLTHQQQEIKERILETFSNADNQQRLFGITGGTGSGKTLLLYDIVKKIAGEGHECCIIHSASLSEGHSWLNRNWDHAAIYPVSRLREMLTPSYASINERTGITDSAVFEPVQNSRIVSSVSLNVPDRDTNPGKLCFYEYVFVDEAHRLQRPDAAALLQAAEEFGCRLVFSYDSENWLSPREGRINIPAFLEQQEGFVKWNLSRRIRTGLEIAAFYRNLLNLNQIPRGAMDYSHIEVIYAGTEEEADQLIRFYEAERQYFCPNGRQAAVPIAGQEYENVLILIKEGFRYNGEGYIENSMHPALEEELDSVLYQSVTRTQGRLCVLVEGSYQLFQQIAGIKFRMMERTVYRENFFASAISGKQVNRLSKALKASAEELPEKELQMVIDTADILQEQLTGPTGSRKIIMNQLHVLEYIADQMMQYRNFQESAEEYLRYVNSKI